MKSMAEERAGRSLEKVLHCFRDDHFVEDVYIDGIDSSRLVSIELKIKKNSLDKVFLFFENLGVRLAEENLGNINIKRTYAKTHNPDPESQRYTIYPIDGNYLTEEYRCSVWKLFDKIPKIMKDFKQKYG